MRIFKGASDELTNALQGALDAINAAVQVAKFEADKPLRADRAGGYAAFVVFYADSKVKPAELKCDYKRECDARRAAMRYTVQHGVAFAYSSVSDYVKSAKLVVRFNMMSGRPFLEAEGTPYYCSPSSETYWSM